MLPPVIEVIFWDCFQFWTMKNVGSDNLRPKLMTFEITDLVWAERSCFCIPGSLCGLPDTEFENEADGKSLFKRDSIQQHWQILSKKVQWFKNARTTISNIHTIEILHLTKLFNWQLIWFHVIHNVELNSLVPYELTETCHFMLAHFNEKTIIVFYAPRKNNAKWPTNTNFATRNEAPRDVIYTSSYFALLSPQCIRYFMQKGWKQNEKQGIKHLFLYTWCKT